MPYQCLCTKVIPRVDLYYNFEKSICKNQVQPTEVLACKNQF